MIRHIFLSFLILCVTKIKSQEIDGCMYFGRFWSSYRSIDYGTGFRNQQKSNYNYFPSISVNKYYKNNSSLEFNISFTNYQQYYSTRKYLAAYSSSNIAGHLIVRWCFPVIKGDKFEIRLKGGGSLGIAGLYKVEYSVIAFNPSIDSVTRGTEKKNFTPIFPMLSTGLDISYKMSKRFKLSLAATYQKGFLRITQYDIYYNDGSGNNDQRAKQWGTGDFYGMQLGLRYMLRDKEGKKFMK
ncbi:MAG: hypothetical protein IPP02_02410 [Chitinophagaceae bacterium]|nr:hypothetical protein [Chitinophagaceae bacterium]MBK8299601.1 hypothetical protein [Chitinophagaceae bacterium]MBK9463651.1 hypothetical protein [Chitinophagaceae bacterium]MBK9659228.1 hypothetical protein [Chitinophagaceae bacterium]MBK9937246.1 hypothetical protein [Chitinophagaceae bacterium]